MANRVFQSVIYQMKDAINRVVGVVDETGAVISCSELNLIGEVREGFMAERLTAGDRFVRDGYTYQQFSSAKHNDYAVFVEGVDETAGQFAYIYALADEAHVALSAPIISAYCAASVLWSRIFLKEKLSWKHYLMIALVVVGIVIIGFFDI